MYPGAPSRTDLSSCLIPLRPYRNLALLRPAYSSSAYGCNLTAQLVTDGLIDTHLPDWMHHTIVDGQILPKTEREIVVDHFESAVLELPSSNPTVELHLGGGEQTCPRSTAGQLFVVVPKPGSVASALTVPPSLLMTAAPREGRQRRKRPALPTENYPPELVRGITCSSPPSPSDNPLKAVITAQTSQWPYPPPLPPAPLPAAPRPKWPGTPRRSPGVSGSFGILQDKNNVLMSAAPTASPSAWKAATIGEEWISVDLDTFPLYLRQR